MTQEIFLYMTSTLGVALIGLLGFAYKEPKFYLNYADMRLTMIIVFVGIFFGAFYSGISIVHNMIYKVKGITPELLMEFEKHYSSLNEYSTFLMVASWVLMAGSFIISGVARASLKHQVAAGKA